MDTIEKQRIHLLNDLDYSRGNYVLYWIISAHRVQYNHALVYSISLAARLKLPVIVYYGFNEHFVQPTSRHLKFMLEGMKELHDDLKNIGIRMVVWNVDPVDGVLNLAEKAAAVITDFGYIKEDQGMIFRASVGIGKRFVAIESNVIVPVRSASSREEYSAGTFRPKMMKLINLYLNRVHDINVKISSADYRIRGIDIENPDKIISEMCIDHSVGPVKNLKGGGAHGIKMLNHFIRKKLPLYNQQRNNPSLESTSYISPYLRFGQLSPVYVANRILETDLPGRDEFLEEMIIRRELSVNFVYYNKDYDSVDSLPSWAAETLGAHESDPRGYIYTRNDLEKGHTHDIYWNAAQNELVKTGKIHNYMRMYWGKKIIEWTDSAATAMKYMIYLNNRYALDGCDPNSYAGIAWCLGKHDRPWGEREIFGKVRYMNDRGLNRKFDMEPYLAKYGTGQ